MTRSTRKILIWLLAFVLVIGGVVAVSKKFVGTVVVPEQVPVENSQNSKKPDTAGDSLSGFEVPDGFSLSMFAKDIPGARVMAFDTEGNMWVSQTSEGQITKIEIDNGKIVSQNAVFRNLNRPHGLVIDGSTLYYAEETKITRVALDSDDKGQKIADLPRGGGGHYTRTLLHGPDDRLYVSIGSTCNVCHEKDERNAAVYSMNKDGTDFKKVAKGLRNAVFMALNPVDGKIYVTEMGRDNLGDDLPPDEINIIGPSSPSGQNSVPNFGWPICYGKNIHDTDFDKNTYIRNPCMEPFEIPSFVDLPAHSAPLGLAFVPEEGWPEAYWYNLLVAYHGSWNRSTPTGYKIARVKLDAKGKYLGAEDFITGWLTKDGNLPAGRQGKIGRPVDIKILPGGVAYISDDAAGVIYKLVKN